MRAARVLRDGQTAGYLGEGPGPFIFASQAAGAYPILKNCRYTSIDQLAEDEIAELLERDPSFEAAAAELNTRGYLLEAEPYESLFLPPQEAPLGGAGGGFR